MLTKLNLTALPDSAEYILNTNTRSPIKLIGVARAQIRNSKQDPWRNGYMVIYEDVGVAKKAEINEQLYSAIHLVFDTLNNLDDNDTFYGALDGDLVYLP